MLGEPMEIPCVGSYVSFLDPEGNRVSMLQPIPRNWHAPKKKAKKKIAKKKAVKTKGGEKAEGKRANGRKSYIGCPQRCGQGGNGLAIETPSDERAGNG